MKDLINRFLSGKPITGLDFINIAKAVNCNLQKNAIKAIDNKVETITLLAKYQNGASIISGYGLRQNTTLMIARAVMTVFKSAVAPTGGLDGYDWATHQGVL